MPEITGVNSEEDALIRFIAEDPQTRIRNLEPSDSLVRINAIAPGMIAEAETPSRPCRIDAGRISSRSIHAMATEGSTTEDAEMATPKRSIDCAYAVMSTAMAFEACGSAKLRDLSTQVKEHLKNIDRLIELNSELTTLPEKDVYELTDQSKLKDLLDELKACNIQIWQGESIPKAKLAELKAQIGTQIEKLRTSQQIIVSTEIQPVVQNLQAIMNIIQQIIQLDTRLKRKTTELAR
ncbi:MAG TPA: hypothetical protein VLE95_03490 [Chlamydiales bacterium]|nr:hypothetical protein [Chlamydiales bacterium]